MGWCTAEGTWPAWPPGCMPPEGQKRSPLYSASERTSTTIVPGWPMASRTAAMSARIGGLSPPRRALPAAGSLGARLLHGWPAVRQVSREQSSMRTSECP